MMSWPFFIVFSAFNFIMCFAGTPLQGVIFKPSHDHSLLPNITCCLHCCCVWLIKWKAWNSILSCFYYLCCNQASVHCHALPYTSSSLCSPGMCLGPLSPPKTSVPFFCARLFSNDHLSLSAFLFLRPCPFVYLKAFFPSLLFLNVSRLLWCVALYPSLQLDYSESKDS